MTQDFPQPISEQIWNRKYRLITPNPDIPNDETVSDTWDRIAKACAESPITLTNGSPATILNGVRNKNELAYRDILEDFNFLTAGRITAGAGSGRNVTLFNCYVMGTVPDDISGIFESLKEAALTMQQGGGIGYDFSTLRPAGSPVKGVDADASGPLTFMDVWDSMCKTIMSAGYRRGAMMATMRCDHPDIEAFIVAKQDKTRLRMFNMSVLCTDKFMQAVKDDEDIDLVHIKPSVKEGHTVAYYDNDGNALYLHKTIRARNLWDQIMQSTYDYAEPGVLFIDVINRMNNLWYMEEIVATNPCGEQPLPPYGACLLGSINLTKMVANPFGYNSMIDYDRIEKTAAIAVRMLDSVIDMSKFPIPQQKTEALAKRRMGIGITGLANMLFMLDIKYGSDKAVHVAREVMERITFACYRESIKLAQLYGPCPAVTTLSQRFQYVQSGFMKKMPDDIRQGIEQHGIRNALLTSIAPTGTISMFAGNISSGIEPVFALEYTRKILDDDGVTKHEELVSDYAVNLLKSIEHTRVPEHMMLVNLPTAQTLTPADHLKMLAAVQPWIDSSISKTINCPKDISMEDFQAIYMNAYDIGLKGCTTYRPNDVTGSVLSVESDVKEEAEAVTKEVHMLLTEPMPRPQNLTGTTYKLKWEEKTFYVTINDYPDDNGHTIPFEIFINSSSMESLQWTVALTRMISAVFRRGGQVRFIGQELQRISDPSGGQWINKRFVPSFVALLGQTLEDHLTMLDRLNELDLGYEGVDAFDDHNHTLLFDIAVQDTKTQCPKCRVHAMIKSGGCDTCTNCGHSKCG